MPYREFTCTILRSTVVQPLSYASSRMSICDKGLKFLWRRGKGFKYVAISYSILILKLNMYRTKLFAPINLIVMSHKFIKCSETLCTIHNFFFAENH